MANEHDINALVKLKPNWDSFGGIAPSPRVIVAARDVLHALNLGGWPGEHLTVVPGGDGSIQLESHRDGLDIEITISPSPSVMKTKALK